MPDKDTKTVRDVIWFQYAKLIARNAFKLTDGHAAKVRYYGFIKNTLRDLRTGTKPWPDISSKDWQLAEVEKKCTYCNSADGLVREPVVPKSLLISERCPTCDAIQSNHKQIWVCQSCSSVKGTMGLYTFFKSRMPDKQKFYDFIPALVEKIYLETVYACLACAKCLDSGDLDGDGELTVLDIDHALQVHGQSK